MKWKVLTYASETGVKPQVCHPHYWRYRRSDIHMKHKVKPTEVKSIEDTAIDYGGMISTNDPRVCVPLGPQRNFYCWEHQIPWLVGVEAAL